jgi:hypothetical protein
MTRARKIDPAVLEREYVYDPNTPGISYDDLAAKHGLARSGVADKGMKGHWAEKRAEFRKAVGMKVVESISEDWAKYASAQRSKMVEAMVKTLDAYIERLDAGEIKPGVRDAVSISAALRVLINDITVSMPAEDQTLDPATVELDPAALADFIQRARGQLRALPSGEEDSDADFLDAGPAGADAEPVEADAPELGPTGTAGTRQD